MIASYRGVIFDLDGTAVPNGYLGTPSRTLIDAIRVARQRLVLIPATGRPWTNCGALLQSMGLTGVAVVAGGSQIVSVEDGRILWHKALNHNDIEAILAACTHLPNEVLFGEERLGEGSPAAGRMAVESTNVIYVIGCTRREVLEIRRSLMIADVSVHVGPSWSGDSFDVHITKRGATKYDAVVRAEQMLGLRVEECIGVGDGDNDVELFRAVAYRVAVQGGSEELLRIADEICRPVAEDGFARYLVVLAESCSSARCE